MKPALGCSIVILALAAALAPVPGWWVERYYTQGFYLTLQRAVTPLTSGWSWALFDPLALLVLGGLLAWWLALLRRPARGRRLRLAATRLGGTIAASAVLYLVFLLAWGLNYRRTPLADRMAIDPAAVTPPAVAELAHLTAARLNDLHAPAHALGWPAFADLPEAIGPAFDRAQREAGFRRPAVPGLPKRSLLNWYFVRAGLAGMTNPFGLEVLVSHDLLPFERASVVAHEWAHLAGEAVEGEASFLGWLTCMHGDVAAQYSGWLGIYADVVRGLPETEWLAVRGALAAGPRADLAAIAARPRRVVPAVQRGVSRVYDGFLKAHDVERGVASYGDVVDLILAGGFAARFGKAPFEPY
jgi:hypothetical protein